MSKPVDFAVEKIFNLTPEQARAVCARGRDVIVTAGAGSGKTRTLVARYLSLLVDGYSPRHLAAITFTEKAAREMRNRARREIGAQKELAAPAADKAFWAELEARMDSARIGTIHSLCAEILRAHPAEAGFPPEFAVLDEGPAVVLRARVAADTVAWTVSQPGLQPLFAAFEIGTLEQLARFALERRLDLGDWLRSKGKRPDGRQLICRAVERFVGDPTTIRAVGALQSLQSTGQLADDAGDRLADQVENLLLAWEDLHAAMANGSELDWVQKLLDLEAHMGLRAGKKDGQARAALKELKGIYERRIDAWLDGSFDPAVESLAASVAPPVERLFERAISDYQARLAAQGALDFDDLEAGALRLLNIEPVRARWQAEIRALLVDEFQDTNRRQREIIDALCAGHPGRLFVVGDGRQSIYRFRGADVTVFQEMQANIRSRGGDRIELGLTFRAHEALLRAAGDLLEPVMAPGEEQAPDYWIAFSPLQAHRKRTSPGVRAPYIELVAGLGESAAEGRAAAGRALAVRLLELKAGGQIENWHEAALLFRASTGFPVYEDALEAAGIPFVTVAGRGFYDRPEVRDVLNLLRAVADPWDDLALAGLLRSPAFCLPDAAIYRLRYPNGALRGPGSQEPRPLWNALAGDLGALPEREQALAGRARLFLNRFTDLAGRLPVADLLERMIDFSDYRAILATSGSRLWRNLDKLLEDARQSRLVQVLSFLEYLESLREVGAREGEADVETEGSVQLMTVHKSKGLEFPLVVLADASYRPQSRSEKAYLIAEAGLGLRPDRFDVTPLAYRILRRLDQDQEAAEANRLLYVAATRAKEKLILSGHLSKGRAAGWLAATSEAAGIDWSEAAGRAGTWRRVTLKSGQVAAAWAGPGENTPGEASPGDVSPGDASPLLREAGRPALFHDRHLPLGEALYLPLESPEPGAQPSGEAPDAVDTPPARSWRAAGERRPPAVVVGEMVHRAIQRWSFPDDPGLDRLLESLAFNAGLVEAEQRTQAIRQARSLLQRLREHPLWEEMDLALERHHEVPYARSRQGAYFAEIAQQNGTCRTPGGKTDWLDNCTSSVRHGAYCSQPSLRITGQLQPVGVVD